jgi:hypothetical protein
MNALCFRTLTHRSWVIFLAAIALTGCSWVGGSKGAIRAHSLGNDPVLLQGNFRNVFFAHESNGEPSFILSDVPLDQIASGEAKTAQVLHVQLLWDPVAGRTPMEPSATNASIRYVVIANGEVGVYSGAGFAMYSGKLASDKRITLTLRDASLQLQDATAGFNDLLSPAQMTGTFTALRDDAKARQMHRAASQIVTNALGKTRLVLGGI